MIKLIVGLANPGPEYAGTRHNVGEVYLTRLAEQYGGQLATDTRLKGRLGRIRIGTADVRLLVPLTFMNLSGDSVGPVARYFRIDPAEILVAYDELAFEPGVVKLKEGGGANGHNGIKSVIQGLGNQQGFLRLRIGIGHPGRPEQVSAWVLKAAPAADAALMDEAIDAALAVTPEIVAGKLQAAMNTLHAPPAPAP